MRVRLTEYEQSMLRGEQGEAKRVALGKIVELAEILGAEESFKRIEKGIEKLKVAIAQQ